MATYTGLQYVGLINFENRFYAPAFEWPNSPSSVGAGPQTFTDVAFPLQPSFYNDVVIGLHAKATLENTSGKTIIDQETNLPFMGYTMHFVASYSSFLPYWASGKIRMDMADIPSNGFSLMEYQCYSEPNSNDGSEIPLFRYTGGEVFVKFSDGKVHRAYFSSPIAWQYTKDIGLTFPSDPQFKELFGPGILDDFPGSIIPPGSDIPIPPVTPENPYKPGGVSSPGNNSDPNSPGYIPPGTFDDTSDNIQDSSIPTISAANTGFTRIYNPTLSQVQDLAKYLWTDDTLVETVWNKIKQYFEDPMQAIIGFNLVPVPVPDGGTKEFALMYIGTGVQMTTAASQFVDVDCGTLKLERYYGSALDQSPYTKVHCFLPFIGTVRLNTDEVMQTTLQVKYRVDIVSGSCVAKIFVDGNCLYQYSGHCAINIPFSAADFSTYVSAAINIAKTAAVGAVAGMAAMPASAIPSVAQHTSNFPGPQSSFSPNSLAPLSSGGLVPSQIPVGPQPGDFSSSVTKASFAGISPQSIANTVAQVTGGKPYIEHSGSFSGNSGYLGIRRPFLIIERPNMCLPENYQALNGFPAMITMKLGDCKGYTRVQQVQLTGLYATNPEQAEIMELLKAGVVF